MRSNALQTASGLVLAVLIILGGLLLGWLCVRVAVGQVLPPTSPVALAVYPRNPEITVEAAMSQLARNPGGLLEPSQSAAVRSLAASRPLDARPYLLLAQAAANTGDSTEAKALLQAGQRLNPRQRLINVLLLDNYLRSGEYTKAAQQFGILSRLVGSANQLVAKALVLMTTDSEMLPAVRRTLSNDRELERKVLSALSQGTATPAQIFDLASPAAVAQSGNSGGWGEILIGRLVREGRYQDARSIWQRVFQVDDAAASALLFNASFSDETSSAPFNWTLAAGSLGAADPIVGGLAVEFYGRESGALAKQTLLLKPGRYRFSFTVNGLKAASESKLRWQIACSIREEQILMNAPLTAASSIQTSQSLAQSSRTAEFVVPSGCPAQDLHLLGEAGEFVDSLSITLRNLALRPVGSRQ